MDVNVDDIVITKLVKTKTNFKYLIGYLDKAIRPLVLIMPKMCGYVKTFKVKEEEKDKNNKLRYYATFKARKSESFFYKINTCLQKTTTDIGLQAEQIFPVNV